MASSSSGATMASPSAVVSNYDIFLSFRGLDTRHSFTDHLYEKLVQAGIRTFRDDDEIETGEELKPEIDKAIKASNASIIVLSENYATSTWCLDELWLILEQRREFNHFVLPIFYHVDPSDVRKHKKSFDIKSKISTRWTNDNVNRWKEALIEVAGLKSEIPSGPETQFIKDIVDKIYNRLDCNQVYLPPNLIGMNTRYKEIESWLKQPDAEFLVICGMGGSGKSTLAKHIVYSNWQKFERISIIEDIGSRCKEPHDLLQLREKLFRDILGGKKKKIPSVCQGTNTIEEVLQTKKTLIVLDDIAELDQLKTLLGTGDINKESKIIITTRLDDTHRWFKSRSWKCQEHKMKLLDDFEALELLSLYAFGSKFLQEGYKELAERVVQYCGGNPLALEVLGSSLSEDISIPSWTSALNVLKKDDIHGRVYRVLIRSYDSLPFDTDRELFLHIACFFVGIDMDYVIKVLEPDYAAVSRIKTLMKRCLLYISPNKKLMMHPLLQEVGRKIVIKESPILAERSRVWCNKDSYNILKNTKGSKTMKGLALDMKILREKEEMYTPESQFRADSLKKMDRLKLLRLDFVELSGSYKSFSVDLRWLSWLGFHLRSLPSELFMGNMVALDMSYSCLAVFEPPVLLRSLKILNLKDSHSLFEIRNISRLPNLETLILWNCRSLVHVCETIGGLKSLVLLNMTGCENLFKYSWKRKSINHLVRLKASFFGEGTTQESSLSLPHSLERLFLKDCNLDYTSYFPLSFRSQSSLQYLNLGNSLFEYLPTYNHLKSLRVLDLTFCSRLKRILCLPRTLAELYIYYCESLEKVTFESSRFTLQEFGYEGCINLCEIEGFIKLVPLLKLDEVHLGSMKWLKKYQNHEVCLVGDDEFTLGRSWSLQMLFEFNIMSISLPYIKDSNLKLDYKSKSSSLSFDVPLCPKDRKLIGLSVTLKYTISGEDWVWFTKISTTSGVNLMYNPRVVGKPLCDEVCIWLSYWPIGNRLKCEDTVNVSFFVMNGLKIHKCGASLVYTDDVMNEHENMQNNINWVGEDLSRFQLSTGAYYLCRRDFYGLTEVGRLTPGWFKILVGSSTVDDTEIRGWRKTGRPMQPHESFTELKIVRCIINGPDSDEVYKIAEMSKSSMATKSIGFISRIIGETEVLSEVTTEAAEVQMMKNGKKMVKGRVVLMKNNILDVNKAVASVLDRMYKLFGQNISFQLISATHPDDKSSEGRLIGKLGDPAILDLITSGTPLTDEELAYEVNFEWKEELGLPGAILVKNNHRGEFFLKTLTLEDIPGYGQLHFVCNSWVYPSKRYTKNRIFFTNKAYLPTETPQLLHPYREEELMELRGNGSQELQEWDRVYDYAFYNDLGNPDHDLNDARPVLGGSSEYPYPRRVRTGRPPTKSDPKTERRLTLLMSLNIYVPRDEQFGDLKLPDFPMPLVIEGDKSAWRTDEEFAREMLAGDNPVSIRQLNEFPPRSKLDFEVYGNQHSSIKPSHIEANLDGLAIKEAVTSNKLFILDHHDLLMPYVRRINATSTKIYATRTLLFVQEDGTLKPLAIELSLPHPEGDHFGAISKVYTPAEHGVKGSIWQLAKAYVAVNDSGVHQLTSHWLNTHCVIEPFVIATNRQLSMLHPIHKLLQPHFRDTMSINALGRQILINSGGILERTVFPGKYAMEMSSMVYKDWVFPEQALPIDLMKRGMAVPDPSSPHGLRLLIEDYPYAVDGLEIWFAIKTWVENYCSFYYRISDDVVQNDNELQSWWKELQEEGHGDKKDEPWWPKMHTYQDLIDICTIIIWVASALHAAVNCRQYSNAYLPNRPNLSHQLMPEPNTPEYEELQSNPDSLFLKTITAQPQALIGVSLIESSSRHLSHEVNRRQKECPKWTVDAEPLQAFELFGNKLQEIDTRIVERNNDRRFKNRVGYNQAPKKGETPRRS